MSHIITVIKEGEGLAEVGGSESGLVLLWNAQAEIEPNLDINCLAERQVDSPRD